MSDKLLQRLAARNGADADADVAAADGEDSENLGCFGWLRGVRDRALALELRKKSGHILAINYAFISKFEFEPATGIILHCSGQTITIKGRNLNSEARPQVRLFQGLTRFRVNWVQEADRAADLQADKKAVVVEAIEW